MEKTPSSYSSEAVCQQCRYGSTWPDPVASRQFCSHFQSSVCEGKGLHCSKSCRIYRIQNVCRTPRSFTAI